jgi:hypothetical protein
MSGPSASNIANSLLVSAGVATMVPGIDGDAVIGAFAGALFFIVFSRDISALGKIGYLFASWVFGYFVASELVARNWTNTSGLVAFIGGLFCVVVCVSLLEWVQGGKTPGWLKFISDRFGGRNG